MNFLSVAGEQAIVRSVEIRGNSSLKERIILDSISLRPSSRFIRQQLARDIRSIRALYYRNGFYFVSVDADSLRYNNDSSEVDIQVRIVEGPRMKIGTITITGNTVMSVGEILGLFGTAAGGYLVPEILEDDIDNLLSRYERVGYPFAEVEVRNISVAGQDSAQLEIGIGVNEGARVTIDDIVIRGNTETHSGVIIREAGIRLHEEYHQDRVSKIRPRLNRMNIFSSVEEPEIFTGPAGSGLILTVHEGNTNTFDGVIGYAPGPRGEGDVNGLVDISMRNLFGTARKFSMHWQKDEQSTQEIGLRYLEPWIANFPVNLGAGFNQRQQDSTYVYRSYDVSADVMISESFTAGATLSFTDIIPSEQTTRLSGSRTRYAGLDVRYDTRDIPSNPTGGMQYRATYQYGSKHRTSGGVPPAGIPAVSSIQRIGVDFEWYIPVVSSQIVMLGVHGRSCSGDALEIGDYFRFGGTRTLRGYRENQFFGTQIAWTNSEYRFLIGGGSSVYGFFDSGYFTLPQAYADGAKLQETRIGYGIGIRLSTSIGTVGVSLAYGQGDSFADGKIHFGLINDF